MITTSSTDSSSPTPNLLGKRDDRCSGTIAERLGVLESQLVNAHLSARRWKVVAMCAAAPLLGALLMGAIQQAKTPDVLRAKRIELVDEADRVTVLLSSQDGGGQVDLWAHGGSNTVRLASSPTGGDVVVFHGEGRAAAAIYATSTGGRLEVLGPAESSSIAIACGESGASLQLLDAQSRVTGGFTCRADGSTGLYLHTADGKELLSATADSSGGALRVGTATGTLAAQMAATASGGVVEALNPAGIVVAGLGATAGPNGGFVQVSNSTGVQVFAAQARDDGVGKFSLASAKGEPNLVAEGGAEDGGTLSMFASGRRLVALGVGGAGGTLNLMDLGGRTVLAAGAATDAEGGALTLKSSAGRVVVRAGINSIGSGEVAVFDGTGVQKTVVLPESEMK